MNITQEFMDVVLKTLRDKGPCSWYEIEALMRADFPTVETGIMICACNLLRKRGLLAPSCYTEDYTDAEGKKHRFETLVYTTDWTPKTALPHWYKVHGFNPRSFIDDLKDKMEKKA